MKAKSILFVLVALGIVMISGVGTAHATVTGIATLNACTGVNGSGFSPAFSAGCGSGPYGTVTLTQAGSNVDVTVTLNSGYYFTGGSGAGKAIYFDLPSSLNIADSKIVSVTSGFSVDGAGGPGGSIDGTFAASSGSFNYAIECASACPGSYGGSISDATTLSFVVDGVTVANFNDPNSDGNDFASSVYSKSGDGGTSPGTGQTTANSISISPEPMSYLLFGSGLLLLGVVSRKKLGLGRG